MRYVKVSGIDNIGTLVQSPSRLFSLFLFSFNFWIYIGGF